MKNKANGQLHKLIFQMMNRGCHWFNEKVNSGYPLENKHQVVIYHSIGNLVQPPNI